MAKALDDVAESFYGRKRSTSIESNTCVVCGSKAPPESFTDELSKKEYTISGLCQTCQDKTFKEPDEDDLDRDDPFGDQYEDDKPAF